MQLLTRAMKVTWTICPASSRLYTNTRIREENQTHQLPITFILIYKLNFASETWLPPETSYVIAGNCLSLSEELKLFKSVIALTHRWFSICRCVCWSARVTSPPRWRGRCANVLSKSHTVPHFLRVVLCSREWGRSWSWPLLASTLTTNCCSLQPQSASSRGIRRRHPLSSAVFSMTHHCWSPLRMGRVCRVWMPVWRMKRGSQGRRGTWRATAS